jgi:hypothetical protein
LEVIMRLRFRIFVVTLAASHGAFAAEPRMEFWNLTSSTITGLTLAPAGTASFGPDQCDNDKDHEVDHDERLRLTGVEPGRYDVQVTSKNGRVCTAHDVEVAAKRAAFSLSDADLQDCR